MGGGGMSTGRVLDWLAVRSDYLLDLRLSGLGPATVTTYDRQIADVLCGQRVLAGCL